MRNLRSDEIGGATVRRRFQMGGRWVVPGETLTGDQLRAIRVQNRTALVETGAIDLWPVHANTEPQAPSPRAGDPTLPLGDQKNMTRYILPVPGGYDVLEGRKLNDAPLKKAEAKKLAEAPSAPAASH